MGLVNKIIIENSGKIRLKALNILTDVIIDGDYLQLRAYADGDLERKRGAKQNIQFTRDKAIEFRDILNKFIGDTK
jgi:hypothetical protein